MATILISSEPGKFKDVAKEIAKIKGVKKSFAVLGRYDVVAFAETVNLDEVFDLTKIIASLPGVKSTETLVEVPPISARLDSFLEHAQSAYRIQGISFDESYNQEVEQYYSIISTSPKTRALTEADRLFVIAVVSDQAVRVARTRHLNVINGALFREALLEYKGPIRDPDDKCEDAANNIHRNSRRYEATLSKEMRRFFEVT